MILRDLSQKSFWAVLVRSYIPRNLLGLEEVRKSRGQKREHPLCDTRAMLHFFFPFLASQPIAVRCFPTYGPHPEDESGSDDQCGTELLLIDLRSMATNLTTWFSG